MRRPNGFTLIEILIVLVILALTAGLVVSRGRLGSHRFDLQTTVRNLTGALRQARGIAIAEDRMVVLRTEPTRFFIVRGPAWSLPPDQSLSSATVAFTPEGESSGGTILAANTGTRMTITVDWLTGRISTAALP